MEFAPVPRETERIANTVIGAAIEVHRHLGPGFLERIYAQALCLELDARGVAFEPECAVTVTYKGVAISGQRIDLIVAASLIVELKAATRVDAAHEAKVLSYLRTTGLRLALILNFNCRFLKDGIKRVVV